MMQTTYDWSAFLDLVVSMAHIRDFANVVGGKCASKYAYLVVKIKPHENINMIYP